MAIGVKVPTLMIWGAKDRFLGPGVARSSYALCESGRLAWIEEATHWVNTRSRLGSTA